jgi:hypothetical protein
MTDFNLEKDGISGHPKNQGGQVLTIDRNGSRLTAQRNKEVGTMPGARHMTQNLIFSTIP